MTLILHANVHDIHSACTQAALEQAAAILLGGGTVAFPTETVYGLGANALSESAVSKIFAAKQRPAWDPLIVHVASETMLEGVAPAVSAIERELMRSFWPGPLTLLLQRGSQVPLAVAAGRAKVGVRMPAHSIARALIELAGVPIAAPSANSFGRISPTTAAHVLEDLDGRIDAVLDGGPTALGLESTVIDASADPPTLYRPGMVPLEALRRFLPNLAVFRDSAAPQAAPRESLPSPGVGIRHYAPRAHLGLVEGADIEKALLEAIAASAIRPLGVLLPDDLRIAIPKHVEVVCWGRWQHPDELAQNLFAGLRELDRLGVKQILCPLPPEDGLGAALRDRLQKAAKKAM